MEKIKNIADWFLNLTGSNKIVIVFIAINVFFFFDNKELKSEVKTLTNGQKQSDSIYIDRLNSISTDFQKKIDDCNKERVESYVRQSEIWQAKFEELFKETDQVYQRYQEVIERR